MRLYPTGVNMALYPDPDNNTTTDQSKPPSVYAAEMGSQFTASVRFARKRRPRASQSALCLAPLKGGRRKPMGSLSEATRRER